MVRVVVKRNDVAYFLLDLPAKTTINDLLDVACEIFNGYLKIHRICAEIDDLAKHGVSLPPTMQGLTDEQVVDLKLKDDWGEKCIPSGGYIECKDDIGRRNGKAPTEKMVDVLKRTVDEVKQLISRDLVKRDKCMDKATVKEALMMLSGAVTIVYPMGLPPYDPIKMELDNEEDLTGTHMTLTIVFDKPLSPKKVLELPVCGDVTIMCSKSEAGHEWRISMSRPEIRQAKISISMNHASQEVIPVDEATIWFSGKEMQRGKLLSDYIGPNEKTKIVAKLSKRGAGAPAREPVVNEEQQKSMMAYYYKKQEEWKKLDANDEDSYLDSAWAEPGQLKRQFHGLGDIKWGPR